MRSLAGVLLVVVWFSSGCRSAQDRPADPPPEAETYSGLIHPKVFAMATGWLSDIAQPVVTEVNLDAMAVNRNQFDPDAVTVSGEWVTYADEATSGFLRYKTLQPDGDTLRVLLQSNEGGTLTVSSTIGFRILRRSIVTDEGRKEVSVLSIESIE